MRVGGRPSCRPPRNSRAPAIKPATILKSADGKTVEVINTDEEVPADSRRRSVVRAQARARRISWEVATLTGAVVVELGR